MEAGGPAQERRFQMFARVMSVRSLPRNFDPQASTPVLLGGLRKIAGFRGVCLLRQLGFTKSHFVSLWDSFEAARSMDAQLEAQLGPPPFPPDNDDLYQVIDVVTGREGPSDAAVAWVAFFDGLRSKEELAARDRAREERIKPATRDLPGVVAQYVLRRPEGDGEMIVVLATSVEAIEAGNRAVLGSELLPGEDPALLIGPDRVEIHHVAAYETAPAPLEAAR